MAARGTPLGGRSQGTWRAAAGWPGRAPGVFARGGKPRGPQVIERWVGTCTVAASDRLVLVDRPSDAVRVVVITSGTGASASFATGEEVVADLFTRGASSHGRNPEKADIDAVCEVFVPMNIEVAARHADLVPGAAATARGAYAHGLKIGSTTGYTREIMERILPVAAAQDYRPASFVCTGDAPDGRPTPLMLYRCLLDLGIWPAWSCVKVDDTEVGIAEGLNGGAWTVGVAVTGNLFGLSLADTQALSAREFAARRETAARRLTAAGAYYVIDGVADLLPVLWAIEGRLLRGERP